MSRVRLLCTVFVSLLSGSAVLSGVVLPDYTPAQLQEKQFVTSELARLSTLRKDLLKQNENASVLVQMTLKQDLKKVDSAIEALQYIDSAGFRAEDPQLALLSYFQSSRKPFEGGFRYNMTPAGPRGGRVSFLAGGSKGRPASRTANRRAAPERPASRPAPVRRPPVRSPR